MIDIRPVTPADYDTVGELTADVYIDGGFVSDSDMYAERLRDTATRADQADVVVALVDGEIVGSVTIAEPESPFADVAEKGELEFRMLAVAASARGKGVGSALVRHVLDVAYDRGDRAVVISTQPDMVDARRIYDRNGFVPAPERNWEPIPGMELTALVRELV
ncbi:GNAT family N-acetyltransferase [Rhodococcus sp. TAF43]|uniref:GNAT family N-acetyltransferase n=1 Tax=unclassified Rhodococcus (in: high G+C Gram-positive bacteria) TaxID=192944 RepID=UPI000E0BC568|nr:MULTISPECIES: GNAT family N-acetyltransferase [unclassified Rhodococcus (in: high G+C Gram-positive bacteria)]QKT12393.1 GNAT family N-acetyltransferase [Rhodococcus sp. W8901]RDI22505.1 putative N-acetyltransferase YhbS [Rhodococcus sp. AG1013]